MTDDVKVATVSFEELNKLTEKVADRFAKKLPVFREAAAVRHAMSLAMLQGVGEAEAPSWFTQVEDVGGGVGQVILWSGLRMAQQSSSPVWFRPSEALTYKLLATDLKGLTVGDLRLPYPCFYVEVPDSVLYLRDKATGWRTVRSIAVLVGEITQQVIADARKAGDHTATEDQIGPRLVIECFGEPNENSAHFYDDAWCFWSYRLWSDPATALDTMVPDVTRNIRHDTPLPELRLGDSPQGDLGEGAPIILLHYLVNLCLYIHESPEDVHHIHEDEIARITRGKRRKQLRKNVRERVARLENDPVFAVGTSVKIDTQVKEAIRTGNGRVFSLSYRTLVRGHWRNQAVGVARAQRVKRWIEPHVRGRDLPTQVVGHTYDLGGKQ